MTNSSAITVICLFLFMGAMGKSAQVPLHTWLPDAMEGPTPVSALIHAATMVTAGVFLAVRMSPVFEFSQTALIFVMFIGAITAFFAATVGLVQNDIKRVIAYSTCSQLGYMFVAIGSGFYAAAMFHLFTHAFFKALLFLGSGSVIHAVSDEQDMRRMGGLKNLIPRTYWMMIIGTIALTGVIVRDALSEPGAGVHYVENTLINSLFGLLCWDAIFMPLPGAFFHPFQRGPADLHSPGFHAARRDAFDQCLALLDTAQHEHVIRSAFELKAGVQSPFVHWGMLTAELLEQALLCLPAAHMKLWFRRLLQDIGANRTGFPDLIRFWPQQRRYEMIEVKGPGDRLQDNQTRWLAYCAAHDMPVRVVHVRWAETQCDPASESGAISEQLC